MHLTFVFFSGFVVNESVAYVWYARMCSHLRAARVHALNCVCACVYALHVAANLCNVCAGHANVTRMLNVHTHTYTRHMTIYAACVRVVMQVRSMRVFRCC